MAIRYEVFLSEYGQETPIDDFATMQQACLFITNHKETHKDERLFGVNELEDNCNDKNIRLLIESTIKALITKFNNSPIKMIENVVNSSIENNWVGLFWNKYEEAKEDSNTSPLSSKPLN